MPKSNRIVAVEIGTIDNAPVESKNVVSNTKTLHILKIVCIGVVISTVASTATFAGIISNQVSWFYIIGIKHEFSVSNIRLYPKEIVDARAELWPLYKSEKQKYAKGKVFIRFPAQLVVNGRIAVDKFPDWRSVLNGSRNKSCTEGALPSTDRGAMKPGTSSSRLRSSREILRDLKPTTSLVT